MRLEHVPLLHVLKELYEKPRDMARFREYLSKMTGGTDTAQLVPLIAANPMAKDAAKRAVDALLAIDAEAVAAEAAREAERRLRRVDLALRVGLTVIDDVQGAWSDRASSEASLLGMSRVVRRERGEDKYPWAVVAFFASEPATRERVREATLRSCYRAAHQRRVGPARTLAELLRQEGRALRFAGAASPAGVDADAARRVIAPHLDSRVDFPEAYACVFGDDAARRMGHAPLGLPPRAGLVVALADALAERSLPEEAL